MNGVPPEHATDRARGVPLWLAVLAVHALAAAVYAVVWRDFDAFVQAVDKPSRFQEDFVLYFYEAGARIGREPLPPSGFLYPAFCALLLAPLAALPVAVASVVWCAAQVAASCGFVLVVGRGLLRLPNRGVLGVAVLAVTCFALLHNFKWGQVSVLLSLAIAAAAAAALRGRLALAGAVLGVAAAVKYYPAWFVLWFVLRGQWRAVAAFAVATVACLVVVPAAALGVDGWLVYDAAILRGARDTGWVERDFNSQFVPHVVQRCAWVRFGEDAAPTFVAVARWASLLAAGACVLLARRCVRGGQPVLALAALATALPFLVTTSWPHYFVLLVLVQAAAFAAAAEPAARRPRTARAAVGLSAALASVGAFALAPSWAHYAFVGMPCWANVVALLGVVAAAPRGGHPPAR